MRRIEFISAVFAVYLLLAVRGSNAITALCQFLTYNNTKAGYGMTLTEITCIGRYRKWFWIL